MAQVVITCPTTGRKVPTGVSLDRASWETATLENNSLRCPACGQTHVWSKKDAELDEQS